MATDDSKGFALSKQLAATTLLGYGIFGAVQVLYRLIWGWRASSRMKGLLKDTPATKGPGHDEPAGWLKDLIANRDRIHDWRCEICQGQPVSKNLGFSWHPGMTMVILNDAEGVRHILKDEFNKYTKSELRYDPFFFYVEDFLGDGIFVVKHGVGSEDRGQEWGNMRKVSAQIFSRKNFSSLMNEVFIEKAEVLRRFLQRSRDEKKQVDLQSSFFNFTLDSIMRIFFGEESNTAVGVPNVYGKAFDTAQANMRNHAVESIAPYLLFSTFLPWPFGGQHGGLARWLWDRLSRKHRTMKSACRVLDREANRLVKKCRDDPQLPERRDLLALFIQAGFSADFVKQMVLHLIIAGRDTTACLLSWTFYELTRNQDIQSRLHEEIMQKLPGTKLDMKSLSASEMPYLNGVIYEALRLWPPVPFDVKMAFEDDVLPGGWKVPAFTQVGYCPYNMGRDPKRYPEPEAFRPERWIPFTAPSPHEFPVFQAGPRICLGMDMALFEAKIATVELLRHCRFEMVQGQNVTYGDKITLDIKSNGKEEFLVHVRDW
ncbi:CYP704C1 [Symbiodinium natans]|uniref:CYP704C1 protein n=1 Tax=Symbiodinium natans TaxID=878477 RepID=A0A812TY64_9DINO|nr:CYP704C1 [Symbiodinium natans]